MSAHTDISAIGKHQLILLTNRDIGRAPNKVMTYLKFLVQCFSYGSQQLIYPVECFPSVYFLGIASGNSYLYQELMPSKRNIAIYRHKYI